MLTALLASLLHGTGGDRHIEVTELEETSADGVFAIGDVTTTGYELTPVAIAAGSCIVYHNRSILTACGWRVVG
jgi:pyruvate/2-oxoglutarate dehydrogenase complex dihydrolipoamide dehydrogenase (E3) component